MSEERDNKSVNSKLVAEGDPLPTFLKKYNNEVGKEAHEPAQDPSPRWIVKRR